MKSGDRLIYTILWKPKYALGLPQSMIFLIGFISIVIWPIADSILYCLAIAAVLYGIGKIIAHFDPEILDFARIKIFKCGKTLGTYKGNEYVP